jgi:hypothetical protein
MVNSMTESDARAVWAWIVRSRRLAKVFLPAAHARLAAALHARECAAGGKKKVACPKMREPRHASPKSRRQMGADGPGETAWPSRPLIGCVTSGGQSYLRGRAVGIATCSATALLELARLQHQWFPQRYGRMISGHKGGALTRADRRQDPSVVVLTRSTRSDTYRPAVMRLMDESAMTSNTW